MIPLRTALLLIAVSSSLAGCVNVDRLALDEATPQRVGILVVHAPIYDRKAFSASTVAAMATAGAVSGGSAAAIQMAGQAELGDAGLKTDEQIARVTELANAETRRAAEHTAQALRALGYDVAWSHVVVRPMKLFKVFRPRATREGLQGLWSWAGLEDPGDVDAVVYIHVGGKLGYRVPDEGVAAMQREDLTFTRHHSVILAQRYQDGKIYYWKENMRLLDFSDAFAKPETIDLLFAPRRFPPARTDAATTANP
jgi:hypothetical protein